MIVNVYRDGLRFTVEAKNEASAEAQVDYLLDEPVLKEVLELKSSDLVLRSYGVTKVERV